MKAYNDCNLLFQSLMKNLFSFTAQVYPGFAFIPSGASRKLSARRGNITGM